MLNAPDPEAVRLLEVAKRAYAGGDKPGAAALARQSLLRRPGEPVALQLLGVIALDAGDNAAARRHLEASNAARPNAATFNMIGVAAQRMGDLDAARQAFARAGELGLVDGWRNLAISEKGAAQIAAYERALALAPKDAASHAGLAQALENRHDLVSARRHAEAALAIAPANASARLTLARLLLREGNFLAAEAAAAMVAEAGSVSAELRIQAWGVIGDARDRRDDARGAFQAFSQANRLSLALYGAWFKATDRLYHPDNVRRMAAFVASTDPVVWRNGVVLEGPAPVFLIGFPRSGTTLLDQILSSHSGIVCLEEKEYFSDALGEALTTREQAWDADALGAAEIARIRASYWQRVGKDTDAVVVDKLPLNIVVLPLIKRVFPDAKIILALRDPRDVVLSCFQQRFTINAAMAQFLELERAAAYYDLVMSLFELCRDRLDLRLCEVRYEDVVADLEATARGLCDFLGVTFEPAMLDFRRTALAREIATPSARQVVEPLYARSVGRWRRYAEDMQPVLSVLKPWAERYGYEA